MKIFRLLLFLVPLLAHPPQKPPKPLHFRLGPGNLVFLSSNRDISELQLTPLLVAAQVDGTLTGVDRDSGAIRWSVDLGPVILGTLCVLSSSAPIDDPYEFWAIEPYGEGALYFFTLQGGLTRVPFTVSDLILASPFSVDQDKIFTGTRRTSMVYVDVETGEISNIAHPLLMAVGRTDYELTIASKSDNRAWNISYTKYGENNLHSDLRGQSISADSIDGALVLPFQEKALLSVDARSNTPQWVAHLNATCTGVYDVYDVDGQHVMVRHPTGARDYASGTYLGAVDGGFYAMLSEHYPAVVQAASPARFSASSGLMSPEEFREAVIGVHRSTDRNTLIRALPESPRPLLIDPPAEKSSFLRVLIRLFENSVFTAVLMAVVYYSLKAGLIPPVGRVLRREKSVIIEKTPEKVAVIEEVKEEPKIEGEPKTQEKPKIIEEPEIKEVDEVKPSTAPSENIADLGENSEGKDSDPELDLLDSPPAEDTASPATEPLKEDEKPRVSFEPEALLAAPTPKKKRKRGSRGGKNKKKTDVTEPPPSNVSEELLTNDVELVIRQSAPALGKSRLEILDEVLGYGSHGTVVYKGTFENRPVAVKRMLLDFYDVASHEVTLLQESDDHPNVVRYFCLRQSDRFLYIALELCQANLEDVVVRKSVSLDNISDALAQMTAGLVHLHRLQIVHRDIKPANILVVPAASGIRVLISDFGLCKKLEPDESSFRGTTASGTSGWRAPELLRGNRVSKLVDIFSLGLVFFYLLTGGGHPFGDRYSREGNILKGKVSLDSVSDAEGRDLIRKMLDLDPRKRIRTENVLRHPFFWANDKKIEFLLKVSDKLNFLSRDSAEVAEFEKSSRVVFNGLSEWRSQFDSQFFANINTFRRYDSSKLMDLLRVIRNKYHHINEIPPEFGITEENFYHYFAQLFPELMMYCYYFVERTMRADFESFF